MISTEYESQRVILNAELTAIALAGGSTAKVREKFRALDEREQAERDAGAAAVEQERAARALAAEEDGLQRAQAAVARLAEIGREPNDSELLRLQGSYVELARVQAEIDLCHERRAGLSEAARMIEGRISLLESRAKSLSGLRVTGQASDRDHAESAIHLALRTLASAVICLRSVAIRSPKCRLTY